MVINEDTHVDGVGDKVDPCLAGFNCNNNSSMVSTSYFYSLRQLCLHYQCVCDNIRDIISVSLIILVNTFGLPADRVRTLAGRTNLRKQSFTAKPCKPKMITIDDDLPILFLFSCIHLSLFIFRTTQAAYHLFAKP